MDKNGDTEALKENGNEAEVLITCSNPECLNNKVTQYPTLALCANTLDPVGNGKCYIFKLSSFVYKPVELLHQEYECGMQSSVRLYFTNYLK